MPVLRPAFAFLALALLATGARAHGSRLPQDAGGIAIPSSGHGELVVLARHYGGIVALAGRAARPDATTRKLANYARIQKYYCLWGLAPYAATDEESPFNQCTHAYLSGARQLLMHMLEVPALAHEAAALASGIDMELIRQGTSLVTCEYSGEVFSTAAFLGPDWGRIAGHKPTLALASAPLALAGLAALGGLALRRRAARDGPGSGSC